MLVSGMRKDSLNIWLDIKWQVMCWNRNNKALCFFISQLNLQLNIPELWTYGKLFQRLLCLYPYSAARTSERNEG